MLYPSHPHTPKPRIHILVPRLKPVTESRPQHAGRGARRTALQHMVLPVEEVRRVAQIERERVEAGQCVEYRRRPFPAVAELSFDAECADVVRMRVDRLRVPAAEIEVARARV